MSFNDGDFVKIDYTARRTDGSLVYTTDEKVAKDADRFNAEARYGPQLVVIGKDTVVKGVDAAVRGMAVGEAKKVELKPADAFGERNEELVNVMRLSDFKEREVYPQPGMQVNIDGSIATIKSVNSGRVVVDLNHPLAGEVLVYDIKVVEKLESEEGKVKAIAEHYSLKPDGVSVSGKVARMSFGASVEKNADFVINKATAAEMVLRYLPSVEKVVTEEEYARSKEGAKQA